MHILQFRSEFKRIVSVPEEDTVQSLIENWDLWQKRIIAYSKMETANRKVIRGLLIKFDESTNNEIKGTD